MIIVIIAIRNCIPMPATKLMYVWTYNCLSCIITYVWSLNLYLFQLTIVWIWNYVWISKLVLEVIITGPWSSKPDVSPERKSSSAKIQSRNTALSADRPWPLHQCCNENIKFTIFEKLKFAVLKCKFLFCVLSFFCLFL